MARQPVVALVLALVLVLGAGCPNRDLAPLTPCLTTVFTREVVQHDRRRVDLLFLVDNSGSMAAEQANLARNFPRMIESLMTGSIEVDDCAAPGRRETVTFEPVEDLNVAVVSSDMGSEGFRIQHCDSVHGDDGIFRNRPRLSDSSLAPGPGVEACAPAYGLDANPPRNFLNYRRGDAITPASFARQFECIARLGTSGCGFEQQLESVLKSLTPASSPVTFARNTVGQSGPGRPNEGFLRDDSVLVVVFVTDEDDCSVSDPEMFREQGGRYSAPLALRCSRFPDGQHPVSRYIDGLRGLRPQPGTLVIAGIVGIPLEVEDTLCVRRTADEVLAHDRMQNVEVNPSGRPNDSNATLRQACSSGANGSTDGATPARRLTQVIKAFGEYAIRARSARTTSAPRSST